MPRSLILCLVAALACGCGERTPDKTEAAPAAADSTSADPAPAESTADNGLGPELPLSGAPRRNRYVQLEVTRAGFDSTAPAAPPGLRNFTVELSGIGVSRKADFALPIQPFVFAQNENGCISRPLPNASWLKRPFSEVAVFTPANPTEGQLAFLVPDDSQNIRILIAPAEGPGLNVAAGDDFSPAWPAPAQVIEDGTTLRVLVLPSPAPMASLPAPAAGREFMMLDVVIENLKSTQGIEFTTSQQLRLIDPSGAYVQPAAYTNQIGCRLDDGDVVPPGHARRLMAVYDMPAGAPRRLQYRGFEVDETSVDFE